MQTGELESTVHQLPDRGENSGQSMNQQPPPNQGRDRVEAVVEAEEGIQRNLTSNDSNVWTDETTENVSRNWQENPSTARSLETTAYVGEQNIVSQKTRRFGMRMPHEKLWSLGQQDLLILHECGVLSR
ncbi:hypothetical protein KY285_007051 [Solanum tuberosum]|nr:hypothetical protein KY285_007051 [Solanum tuberosum]